MRLPISITNIFKGQRLCISLSAPRRIIIALNQGKLNFQIWGGDRDERDGGRGWMIVPNNPRPHLTVCEQHCNLWFHPDKQPVIIHLLHTLNVKLRNACFLTSPPPVKPHRRGEKTPRPTFPFLSSADFWISQMETLPGKNVTKGRRVRRGPMAVSERIPEGGNSQGFNVRQANFIAKFRDETKWTDLSTVTHTQPSSSNFLCVLVVSHWMFSTAVVIVVCLFSSILLISQHSSVAFPRARLRSTRLYSV